MQMPNQTQAPKGKGSGFFSLVALFAVMANLKTAFTLGVGVFKFGWILPMIGTMVLSMVLYAMVYGWSLALIVIPLILVHELGHWIWMKAYKLDPAAPIFIPFLGAFVAMKKMPASETTHAWVAFAGPFVGGLGALACYAIGVYFNQQMFIAAAFVGFALNLMQLIPAKPLDGGFIVGAISKWLLVPGVIGLFYLAYVWHSVFLDIIGVVGILSLFKKDDPLGVTAATVGELEKVLVASVGATVDGASDKVKQVHSGKSTLVERVQIGVAYLALAASLGLMMSWISLETGHAEKTFADTQIKVFDRVLAIADGAELRYLRGQLYLADGKIDKATVDLKRAIELGKHDFKAYYSYARCLLLAGRTDAEVIDNLRKAEAAAKPNTDDDWSAAYGLLLCGEYSEVIKDCEHMPDKLDLKAEVMERHGNVDEAGRVYDQAITKIPEYYWGTRWRRAMYYISQNKLDVAKPELDKALSNGTDQPNPLLTEGWYYYKKGDLNKAWKSSDQVLEKSKDYTDLDREFCLAGCHRLRYLIAKDRAAVSYHLTGSEQGPEQTKQNDIAVKELAEYNRHPGFALLYMPRGYEKL